MNKIYVVMNEKYIAAITNSATQFSEWCKESVIPENMKIETHEELKFPIIAFENNSTKKRYYRLFNEGDFQIEELKKDFPKHTIFYFDKSWKGQPDWSDYMGELGHEHFED